MEVTRLYLIIVLFFISVAKLSSKLIFLDPQWNSTKILFYGDEIFAMGYAMPKGFINIFSEGLSNYLQEYENITWNDVVTVTKPDIQVGFNDLRTTLEEEKPTILFLQFGYSDINSYVPEIEEDYSYFWYYLEVMVAIAQEYNTSVVVCSSPLTNDNIYDVSDTHLSLEHLSGIIKSISIMYNSIFLDIFSELHYFIDKYNVHRFDHHVVTYNGKILNETGNKLIAALLLELFGITPKDLKYDAIYRSNGLISSSYN